MMRCDRPMMAFIGVRISWLMLARNIDLVRVASSALSFAVRSSEACRRSAVSSTHTPFQIQAPSVYCGGIE